MSGDWTPPSCHRCGELADSNDWDDTDIIWAGHEAAKIQCPYCDDGYFYID